MPRALPLIVGLSFLLLVWTPASYSESQDAESAFFSDLDNLGFDNNKTIDEKPLDRPQHATEDDIEDLIKEKVEQAATIPHLDEDERDKQLEQGRKFAEELRNKYGRKPGECELEGKKYNEGDTFDSNGFHFECIRGLRRGVLRKVSCVLPNADQLAAGDSKEVGDINYTCEGNGDNMRLSSIGSDGKEVTAFLNPPELAEAEFDCRGEQCHILDPEDSPHCLISADPHTVSFDQTHNSYQGTCRVTAAVPNDDYTGPHFRVSIKAEHRRSKLLVGGLRASYVKWVKISVYGQEYHFGMDNNFMINGYQASAPYFYPATVSGEECNPESACNVIVLPRGNKGFTLSTDFGLVVSYDGKHKTFISLQNDDIFKGKVYGLCGLYDVDDTNDYMLPNGTLTENYNVLGDAWIEEEEETDSDCTRYEDPEIPEICADGDRPKAEEMCAVLQDTSGPFAECIAAHPQMMSGAFDDCIFDVCAYSLDEDVRCVAVEAVGELCQKELDTVIRWRKEDFCPLPCESGMEYNPCMVPVAPSCMVPHPELLGIPAGGCIEGCECPKDHMYENGTCIDPKECGCMGDNNVYHQAGTTWISNECGVECTCQGLGVVECTEHKCPGTTTCLPNPDCGYLECACDEGQQRVGDECVAATTLETTVEPTEAPTPTATPALAVSTPEVVRDPTSPPPDTPAPPPTPTALPPATDIVVQDPTVAPGPGTQSPPDGPPGTGSCSNEGETYQHGSCVCKQDLVRHPDDGACKHMDCLCDDGHF